MLCYGSNQVQSFADIKVLIMMSRMTAQKIEKHCGMYLG